MKRSSLVSRVTLVLPLPNLFQHEHHNGSHNSLIFPSRSRCVIGHETITYREQVDLNNNEFTSGWIAGVRTGTPIQATALLVCARKRTFGSIDPVDSYSGICLSFLFRFLPFVPFQTVRKIEKKLCDSVCGLLFVPFVPVTDTFQFLTCLIFLPLFVCVLFSSFSYYSFLLTIRMHTQSSSGCVRSSLQCVWVCVNFIFWRGEARERTKKRK